jgi:para-aminobenzoate synthetase/4-amino-4-deoxychorismate lyase
MLARDGRIQALGAHLDRLAASVADLYGASLPAELPDDLRRQATALPGDGRLRVDAAPGRAGAVNVNITASPLAGDRRPNVVLRPVIITLGLGHHKWADRRLIDSAANGGSTPVIVDSTDEVLEAAWANVWLIEEDRLITPPDDGRILPGVTRGLLLKAAPALGLEAREEAIPLGRARAADGILLTSSIRHSVTAELGPEGEQSEPERTVPAGLVSRIADALAQLDWE